MSKGKRCISIPSGHYIHGITMVYVPKIGSEMILSIVTLGTAAFAINMEVHIDDIPNVARVSPFLKN